MRRLMVVMGNMSTFFHKGRPIQHKIKVICSCFKKNRNNKLLNLHLNLNYHMLFFSTVSILIINWASKKYILEYVRSVCASYRFVSRSIPQYFRSDPPFSSWDSWPQREAAPALWDLLTESKVRDERSDLPQRTGTRQEDVSGLQVTVDYRERRWRAKKNWRNNA